MIKNFFKIAWRNLKRSKHFTFINIIGLAIGMAAAMLILLWVKNEVSFDRFYSKTDRLYVVGGIDTWSGEKIVNFTTPKPMAAAIKTDYPEVEDITRVSWVNGFLMTAGEKKIIAERGAFVDSTFLKIFDLPVLAGDPLYMLDDPTGIVIAETLAERLYGTTDVLGKTIKIDSTDVFTISGVLKDVPSNSRLYKTEYFLPWSYLAEIGASDENWDNNSVTTYLTLTPETDIEQFSAHFESLTQRHFESEVINILKPITESYLYNKYENGQVVGGRVDMVRMFFATACFILLIACINFMNLSTAQSEKRSKEIGVRKVAGATRRSLIAQFLCESILIATISGILAVVIVILSLPSFNEMVDMNLGLNLLDISSWIYLIIFVLLTGIIAGSYPALFLSSLQPVKVIKGAFHKATGRLSARKVLVVTQFCIAVILIVSTLIIRKQIQYGLDREIGYSKDNLIYVLERGDISKNINSIKNELLNQGIATSVTRTMSPLTERWSNWNGFQWEGKAVDNTTLFNRFTADNKIVETAGLTLIEGRDFDLQKFSTDSTAAIINEAAVEAMGFQNPIGKTFSDGDTKFQIIGVIKDFIQESPFEPIKPLIIEGAIGWLGTTHIKFNPNISTAEALAKTEKIFKEFNPNYPFEYKFIDEAYAMKFEESQQTGNLATLFAFLTILISCLGLFGLAAFTAENRTKEIGVRKVLGASVFSITQLLSKDFVLLVLISCLIAFPIAYWVMYSFLQSFVYRISIGWQMFVLAGVGALLIALITVSSQAIKAAIANPVDSLRDE